MSQRICAVIVTYNRKLLLKECLSALRNQTRSLDCILVVNNASTDGTEKILKDFLPDIEVLNLPENIGSAGGFFEGIKRAFEKGFDWFWIMDDDCLPKKDALSKLIEKSALNDNEVYGSLALRQEDPSKLVWFIDVFVNGHWTNAQSLDELPEKSLVKAKVLPFLGLFIGRKIVQAVGYPDKNFFIWADDVEYSLRITKDYNFKINLVTDSIVLHPSPIIKQINLLFKKTYHVSGPPWKVYYGIRNLTYLMKKYEPKWKFYLIKIPKRVLYILLVSFFIEDQKLKRFILYFKALKDGIQERLGK